METYPWEMCLSIYWLFL